MKQFLKSLSQDEECFKYLCSKLPRLSETKLKAGVFVGPGIRKLLSNSLFPNFMNETEREAWDTFKDVVHIKKNTKMNITNILHDVCQLNSKLKTVT